MKLTVKPRLDDKKGILKQMRREGQIPAILYSAKETPLKLAVDSQEFGAVLRALQPGQLPTTIFTLSDGKKEWKAIVKDIQRHLTTYNVTHLDFEVLYDDVPVSIKVPIQCTGVVDCQGIKLGGFLRQVVRYVKVKCLPRHIPKEFQVDVRDLAIKQSRRLKDITMPQGVKPLADQEEVVVVIAKR